MLYINTLKINEKSFAVNWRVHRHRAGIINVNFKNVIEDAKALAEIYALSILVERFSGLDRQIVTNHGAMKKIINGAKRKGSEEIAFLKVSYPCLSIEIDRKTAQIISEFSGELEELTVNWESLGRPVIETSIGAIEVTQHSMDRYQERIAKTGNLTRLANLLSKRLIPTKEKNLKQNYSKYLANNHRVYLLEDTDIYMVIAHYESGLQRLITCYRKF